MQDVRPDILGSVAVRHPEAKWTTIISFRSEQDAGDGERQDVPAEMVKAMEELHSLALAKR